MVLVILFELFLHAQDEWYSYGILIKKYYTHPDLLETAAQYITETSRGLTVLVKMLRILKTELYCYGNCLIPDAGFVLDIFFLLIIFIRVRWQLIWYRVFCWFLVLL